MQQRLWLGTGAEVTPQRSVQAQRTWSAERWEVTKGMGRHSFVLGLG